MDREQFIKRVEGTQKAFRRFLVALCCGDSQLADDIAQEAYIKAYLSIGSLSDPDKFNSWIFRIGCNVLINHRRSQKKYVGYKEAEEIVTADSPDSNFKFQELYSALDKLPDKERISVLLFYMEGYSIREISEIIEVTQDAVKKYLSRGRVHLRGLLSTR